MNRIAISLLVYGCLLSPVWFPATLWPFARRWGQRGFRVAQILWVLALLFWVANLSDRSRWQWSAMFVFMGASMVLAGAYVGRSVQCEQGRLRRLWPILVPVALVIPLVLSVAATVSIVSAIHEEWDHRADQALRLACRTMDNPQLRQMLLSHEPRSVLAASAELASRSPNREDLATVVTALSDRQLGSTTRCRIGFDFFYEKAGSIDSETLPGLAALLYDPDPEIQLYVAWLICEGAADAPPRFDIWAGSKEALVRKHEQYVPVVRKWWEARSASSTQPATAPSPASAGG